MVYQEQIIFLPTNMTSKYSSGLSVSEFCKKSSYINLSKKGIESLGPSAITLANYEEISRSCSINN